MASGGGDRWVPRRVLLRGTGAVAVAVFAPLTGGGMRQAVAVPRGSAEQPRYLTRAELETLRAVVDRIVPEDHATPGGARSGCAEAIDGLLGAFREDPPLIFAGAPFSDRAGSPVNHFAEFLPLDSYEETAWRLRIEGSRDRPERTFNGPVTGFQTIYRDGLAALDEAAVGGRRFADLTAPEQDLLLATSRDPAVTALMDVAVPHTFEFQYGAPEYGGNADLAAWDYTGYPGDVQPRGWTREEVEEPDRHAGPVAPLPGVVPADELVAALALAHPDAVRGVLARSGGLLSGLRGEVGSAVAAAKRHGAVRGEEGGSTDGW
ncbi:gluconate 2-dehydrogenase subunit 3 family protein [Haloechinothrix sp. YIM 98757]|uniref:Gluconate 2-dehydrogenase subunit 3 family protein n=1 Tax=Haloechinothrix aidingensis TaxID=2752311 RepID=A0A838AE45_9PSEU|nr:gluconate 2-dehydrogenase subunit 3 family protein [Haloechinothrix aidingensis]MBA0127425.1 gluconate 2-dehydrogenase subunit 3 family protein [Haloechinothrix aidingensis]